MHIMMNIESLVTNIVLYLVSGMYVMIGNKEQKRIGMKNEM